MSGSVRLELPVAEAEVRALRAGDRVSVGGLVHTGRDRLHKHLGEGGECPVDWRGGAVFHCGPVMVRDGECWRVVAAGPTTSIREEPYMADLVRRLGLRVIIGKGGMGARTLAACAECGCVYLQAVGGAAALTARRIAAVEGVDFLEAFGPTEAMWHLRLDGLEAIVGMDAQGNSLYDGVRSESETALRELIGR